MNAALKGFGDSAHARWLAALLVLAFALYANTLFNGFVYDDAQGVLGNAYIQSFQHVGRIFHTTVFSFMGQDGNSNYYRPLLNVAYLLVHSLFGNLPFGYHLLNVLLNVAVVALVFAVSFQLFRDHALALLAAALFALHPVHTEAVAWIACIADLELAVFYLLAFLCFLLLGEAPGRRAVWLHAGMLASFILALLSKEPAITLPVMAAIYEHFCRSNGQQISLRTKVTRYAGLWLVAAVYLLFRVFAMGGAVPLLKHPDVTWSRVPLSALALLAQYIGKLFWPWPLSVAYPFQTSVSIAEPRVLAGLLVLLVAIALSIFLSKKSRAFAFALLWIFLMLAPALNARWMATYVFAERNLYLASAGFSWLVAAGILWLWRREGVAQRFWHIALASFCAALFLSAVGATIVRNREFRDDGTLFTSALALHPDAALIQSNLGVWHWNRGQPAEAERRWRTALQYEPQNAFTLSNLGMAMLEQKQFVQAAEALEQAAASRPNFSPPHFHLARLYAVQNLPAEAEKEFRTAIDINPFSTAARNSFAQFCLESGRLDDAATQFRASLDSIPGEDAWAGLAEVYTRQGRSGEAEQSWKEVTRLNPFHARAHFALGKIYFNGGRLAEAEKEFEAGLFTDPHNVEALAALREIAAKSTQKP